MAHSGLAWMVGKVTFTMSYQYHRVNGVDVAPVHAPTAAAGAQP